MKQEELLKQLCNLIRNTGGECEIKNDYIIMKSCDFRNISFGSTIKCMENVVFVDCKLINVGFSNTIDTCAFIGCDLTGSVFANCRIYDTMFLKTNGISVSFDNCYIRTVGFYDVRMSDVNIAIDCDDDDYISLSIKSSVMNDLGLANVNAKSYINIEYSYLNDMHIMNSYLGGGFVICGSILNGLHMEDNIGVYSSIIRDSEIPRMYVESEYFSPMCNNINFTESKFNCREVDGAQFIDCNMSRIKFNCDDIKNTYFRNCALVDAKMSDCDMIHNVDFTSCKFLYTDIRGSHFHECNFSSCTMRDVKLSHTEFTRTSESDPNYIDLCTCIDVDGIKWDGIEITDMIDGAVVLDEQSTLKQQIIHEIIRRKNA